ncbi:hypothetical protein GWK47_004046 [Chionoecetes opilio]|uniref:Uncharacterized protein n=1 Tax=Chionoecetes opilio TaxID=41210 RepID=A0A8J4YNH5_CHIOP|nr:hypothetical protein GWK47_004046 [Chionoecetes opilio]
MWARTHPGEVEGDVCPLPVGHNITEEIRLYRHGVAARQGEHSTSQRRHRRTDAGGAKYDIGAVVALRG